VDLRGLYGDSFIYVTKVAIDICRQVSNSSDSIRRKISVRT
jgi:hypothetical protein